MFCNVATADENPYVVDDILVDVSGKSPVDAKSIGTKTARRNGLFILLNRLSIDDKVFDRINDQEISDMVRSEEVSSEKNVGNKYSAKFSITFAKDFVEDILVKKKSKTDERQTSEQSQSRLIIPVKIVNKKILLWERTNNFKSELENLIKKRGENNLQIPQSDVENMSSINVDEIQYASFDQLEQVATRYGSDTIFVAIYDNKKIDVILINKFRKIKTGLSFVNTDKIDDKNLMEKVSEKLLDHIANLKNDHGNSLETAVLDIEIVSLGNWLMIKNRIENSDLVSKIAIESISRDYAKLAISYPVGIDLVFEFSKKGMTLIKKPNGSYLLSSI
jgi:hypothetical protein